jgi:hypothetical protein
VRAYRVGSFKRKAAAAAATVLASVTLVALAPATPAYADPPCQSGGVYVLWARGSGQGFNSVQAVAFQSHVEYALNAVGIADNQIAWAELGNLDNDFIVRTQHPKEYPAVPVPWSVLTGEYADSVTIGTNELVIHLNDRYNGDGPTGGGACANETAILGGFSQGADAIGWALERDGGGGYESLSQVAKNHVGFAAFYGDPKYSRKCGVERWWPRGNWAPDCSHFGGMLGARDPYARDEFRGRLGSWCDQDDGVCTGYSKWLAYGVDEGNHNSVYNGYWIWQSAAEIAAVTKYQRDRFNGIDPSLLVARAGTSVLGKASLTSPWAPINPTPATDIKVSGGRIGYTDTGAQLRVKDGLYGKWENIYGPASEYAMSTSVLVVRDGNVLHAKFGSLTSSWVYGIQATPATQVRVAGNRITYTDTNGQLWARDGLGGAWVNVYGPVTRYAASNSLIVIQLGTNIYGKAGLTDAWVQLNPSPVGNDLRVTGNRITWTDTGSNLFGKDGLGGGWVNVSGPVDQYTASPSLFVVRGGTGLHGKAGSLTSGWVWGFNATPAADVRASGDRITYTQTSNGSLWAKDGISGGWVNVYGPASQYALS